MVTGRLTEELIWHFIGYMHLAEQLNKAPVTFNASYTTKSDVDIVAIGSAAPGNDDFGIDSLNSSPVPPFFEGETFFQLPTGISFSFPFGALAPWVSNSGTGSLTPLDELNPGSPSSGSVHIGLDGPPLPIQLSYRFFGEIHQYIHINQQNLMVDNDRLLGPGGAVPADARDIGGIEDELAGLIALANEQVPDEAVDPGLQPMLKADEKGAPGNEFNNVHIINGAVQPDEADTDGEDGTPSDSDGDTDQDGDGWTKFATQDVAMGGNEQINSAGIQIVPGSGPAALDVSEIGIDQTNDMTEEDLLVNPVVRNEGTATQIVNGVETSASPTYAQTAVLGGNQAMNAASIIDFSDGAGSIVVMGDYFETNAIVQTNVLVDTDQVWFSEAGQISNLYTHDNTTINDAEFVDDARSVFGNAALGQLFPGADWHVDYVMRDFYDVTEVVQFNTLHDNDINVQTTISTEFAATLGENNLLNEIRNFEIDDYDLIIVGGDYYEFNSIVQSNVLLDSDILKLHVHDAGDAEALDQELASQSALAGGNELLNQAAIVNIGGGAQFHGLTGAVAELAEAVGAQETEFLLDYSVAAGLPGNGSNIMNVLYVARDYYEYKTILQTNIVADVDYSEQVAHTLDELDESDPGGFVQDVVSGDNTEINSATIIDVDSTSGFQFLGGNYYEASLLVQAEFVSDHDIVTANGDDAAQSLAALMPGLDDVGTEIADAHVHLASSTPGNGADDPFYNVLN